MPIPKYGTEEGLADRLDTWADRLGRDKTLPWIGLGIIADLRAAAAKISGQPIKTPQAEYDL
jgi:hypothetical protein